MEAKYGGAVPLLEVEIVACPYAKKIRGTVSFCSLINKKVSTLRYPCKGNYKRCPIYIRYRSRAAAAPRPKPVREEAPKAVTSIARSPAREEVLQKKEVAPPRPSSGPSKSLCDSLILAALITSARAIDRFRGTLRDLMSSLSERTKQNNSLLFFVGQVSGVSVRMLAYKGRVVYTFERGGTPICESDALNVFEENVDNMVDGIIYEIRWEDIPLWRETVLSEFG